MNIKKKSSVDTEHSMNKLSYLDKYEEIKKYKRKSRIVRETHMVISRKIRWFIFCLFIFITLLMNLDHGAIPAATENIRQDLGVNDKILGTFGSLVFLGNLIGIIY
jgi:hypothetical protein